MRNQRYVLLSIILILSLATGPLSSVVIKNPKVTSIASASDPNPCVGLDPVPPGLEWVSLDPDPLDVDAAPIRYLYVTLESLEAQDVRYPIIYEMCAITLDDVLIIKPYFDQVWQTFLELGFTPPSFPNCPSDPQQCIDVYLWYINQDVDGNCFHTPQGFGGQDRVYLDVYWLGVPRVDVNGDTIDDQFGPVSDIDRWTLVAHELFHTIQWNYDPDFHLKVMIEGQARAIQDKINEVCDLAPRNERGSVHQQIDSYLGDPSRDLTDLSYDGVLFWLYCMEKYGYRVGESGCRGDPGDGIDFLIEYWLAVEDYDISIAPLDADHFVDIFNNALIRMGYSGVTFFDVYCDFIVANYAKDLKGESVPEKYRYFDETQRPGSYGSVALNVDETPSSYQRLWETTGELDRL
ncbi:MAG: hypothetical protein RTU92_04975, partial [Candidatus Thorarchaeota archaeon]